MRQLAGCARNSAAPIACVGAAASDSRKKGPARTAVSPIEPNGTSPISTLRPDKRSHSSEPAPTPTENSREHQRRDMLVAAQHVLAVIRKLREEHRAVEPEP